MEKAINLRNKFPWVIKTDIKSFFDRIDRKYLFEQTNKRFGKSSLVKLIVMAINCEADVSDPEDAELLKDNNIISGIGIRQGMPLSPLLSNFFLKNFDKVAFNKIGHNIIRYADDIIAFANSEEECKNYLNFIDEQLSKIGQEIPSLSSADSKTVIIKPENPVNFLGIEIYKTENGYRKKIRSKTLERIKEEFTKEASFDYAIKKELTFPELIQRLKNKVRSYKSTYIDTDNCDVLIKGLETILIKEQGE